MSYFTDHGILGMRRIFVQYMWMDDLRFYVLFNSISVTSGRWLDENEKLCAMEPSFTIEKIIASGGARTHDRYISRSALNPLSYWGSSVHVDIVICD